MKKKFRRLSRLQLLEITMELTKENEMLRQQIAVMQNKLDSREIEIHSAGSLAEASLRLNGVFEAAQAAADQYLENVHLLAERALHE